MKIKCNSCEHSDVCGKRAVYARILDDIEKCVDSNRLGGLGFELTLGCKNYKTDAEYEKYFSSLNVVRRVL